MNDDTLKRMFDSLPATPSAEAKARARAAALQAFDEAHADARTIQVPAQGTAKSQRPTSDDTKQGSNVMYGTIAQKRQTTPQYAGLAAAVVLVLGGVIAQQALKRGELAPVAREVRQAPEKPASEVRQGAGAEKPVAASTAATKEAEIAKAEPAAAPLETPSRSALSAQKAAAAPSIEAEAPVSAITTTVSVASPQAAPATADVPTRGGLEEVVVTAYRRAEAVNEIAIAIQPMGTSESTKAAKQTADQNRDRFETTTGNPIKKVTSDPVSTFSIDVDTASYSFVRRQLNQGVLPEKAAVRLEEMVNYFPYAYAPPKDARRPFSTQVTVVDSPWKSGNKLLHIGIKGYALQGQQPKSNLVFLLDVSGSMASPDKLPLVKQSLEMLVTRLQPEDTVAIVVYAGAAGTVLEPTAVKDKEKILAALGKLTAGGSTAGGEGIVRAYQLAEQSFLKDGVNRIILATDGDFNVGVTDTNELERLIERKRKSGVFLSVLGFGQGNYRDELMQKLAQNGNGVAAYIDSSSEAKKVLVDEATSTLFPIAKDVKIQVEFNPKTVSEYRLLGYESRMLAEEDFNNDAVDAGDVGSGHTVTAIYEITPVGSDSGVYSRSRYSDKAEASGKGSEYGFLKLRYKLPKGYFSKLIEEPIKRDAKADAVALQETRFAVSVAGFAQLLQGGKYLGDWSYDNALELASTNRGDDPFGYRSELVELIRKAKQATLK